MKKMTVTLHYMNIQLISKYAFRLNTGAGKTFIEWHSEMQAC